MALNACANTRETLSGERRTRAALSGVDQKRGRDAPRALAPEPTLRLNTKLRTEASEPSSSFMTVYEFAGKPSSSATRFAFSTSRQAIITK